MVKCAKKRILEEAMGEDGDISLQSMFDKYDRLFFKGKLEDSVDYRWSTFNGGWAKTARVTFPRNENQKLGKKHLGA